jgi:hypothetical protein
MNGAGERKEKPLAYESPRRRREVEEWKAIPVWKHVVFVPVLFWLGLAIVGGILAVVIGAVTIVWKMLTQ